MADGPQRATSFGSLELYDDSCFFAKAYCAALDLFAVRGIHKCKGGNLPVAAVQLVVDVSRRLIALMNSNCPASFCLSLPSIDVTNDFRPAKSWQRRNIRSSSGAK